jgi:hypothetical protein
MEQHRLWLVRAGNGETQIGGERQWQGTTPFFLDINRWAYGELKLPVYPEAGIYRQVTARICQVAGSSPDIRLRIKEKPDPWTGRRKSEFYDCNHLFEDR